MDFPIQLALLHDVFSPLLVGRDEQAAGQVGAC
jgi:hypothetical protein